MSPDMEHERGVSDRDVHMEHERGVSDRDVQQSIYRSMVLTTIVIAALWSSG